VDWIEQARAAEEARDWDVAIALVSAHAECYSSDFHLHDKHLWRMDLLACAARIPELSRPADHGVTLTSFAAAPSAPLVGLDDPASQHSTVGFEALAGDVEVFQMGSVRTTSILGRPRLLSRDSDAQTQPEARFRVTVRSGLLRVPTHIGQRRTR